MGERRKWRKLVKKLRRQRIRRKNAEEREKKLKEEEEQLRNDPVYLCWLKEQEILEEMKREAEELQRDEEEEKWLRRELLAQKMFREERRRRQQAEQAKEEERLRIQNEFEEQQRLAKQRQEDKLRLVEEEQRRRERLLEKIREYVDEGCETPEEFKQCADTNPGKELCPFFSKTASCRFGDKCSRNHSRPGISKTLLLPHFFHHIRLEQSKSTEYGSDFALEYSDADLYKDFSEFFEDVVPELEKYGKLENLFSSSNCEPHLRGNVYVEYKEERDALRAFMRLQGRYYAGKRINVEFARISSWKAAICGLSLSRRCPKGKTCNFLHIFRNPLNKFNAALYAGSSIRSDRKKPQKEHESDKSQSWNNVEGEQSQKRNWRWSETPERPISRSKRRSRSKSRSTTKRRGRSKSHSRKSKSRSERVSRRGTIRSRSRSGSSKSSKSHSMSRVQNYKHQSKYKLDSSSKEKYRYRKISSSSGLSTPERSTRRSSKDKPRRRKRKKQK